MSAAVAALDAPVLRVVRDERHPEDEREHQKARYESERELPGLHHSITCLCRVDVRDVRRVRDAYPLC